MGLQKEFMAGQLPVSVYDTEIEMGKAAAAAAAAALLELQKSREEINIIFAAAVSQDQFLNALTADPEIDWSRVNAFHMDEYYGLEQGDKKSLAYFLTSRCLDRLSLKNRFFLNGGNPDCEAECRRYEALLDQYPIDLVFMGIGDNGHLAFNDPHIADFKDSRKVKMVKIDEISKRQQVNAGNFSSMEEVPSLAFTVTIPALLNCKKIFCMAPTAYKAEAVRQSVYGEISEKCPASILRTCGYAHLYLDGDSGSKL